MTDGWATFGKGVFVLLAVAGGVWLGRGGQLPPHLALPTAAVIPAGPHLAAPGSTATAYPIATHEFHPAVPPIQPAYPHASDTHFRGSPPAETRPGDHDSVRLASYPSAVAAPLVEALVAVPTTLPRPRITTVTANGVVYDIARSPEVWVKADRVIEFSLDPAPPNHGTVEFRIQSGSRAHTSAKPDSNRRLVVSSDFGDVVDVEARLIPEDASTHIASDFSAPIRLHFAAPPEQFRITKVSNNRYVEPVPAQTVNAYGGFIRLEGTTAASGQSIVVGVERTRAGGHFEPAIAVLAQVVSDPRNIWRAEVRLPTTDPSVRTGRIVAYVSQGAQRRYATETIGYTVQPLSEAKINLTRLTAIGDADDSTTISRTNASQIEAHWTDAAPDSDAAVVLLSGNSEQVAAHKTATASGKLQWTIPAEGRHRVQLGVVQGDQIVARSPQTLTIDFRQHGPRPTGVELLNPQQTAGAAVIRVAFDPASPLATTSGSSNLDVKYFELRRDHPPKNDTSGGIITIDSAVYRVDSSTVELKINIGLEADGYSLTVRPLITDSSGVRKHLADVFGNRLGATPENASSSPEGVPFAFSFFKSVGEDAPTQSRGISGVTAPYIEYPEYTRPRQNAEGFNPSDKVVTRVSRLYYYRDAHRVTQLINRKARSFNRQAVDQQQQLADNALRDAENATDARRFAEREAVRAAQKARAAESALTQAQAALVHAEAESRTAGNGLPAAERAIRDQQVVVADAQARVTSANSALDTARSQAPTQEQLDAAQTKVLAAEQNLATVSADPQATPEQLAAAQQQLATARNESLQLQTKAANVASAQADANAATAQLKGAQARQTSLEDQRDDLVRQRDQALARLENSRRLVNTAAAEVQAARQEEIRLSDSAVKLEAREDQSHKTLFRREVAAATADPDTFAPGNPNSNDPIEQVSLSVIGEGEIQLRGPLKGVNMARTLINQIDAPVGQVRVSIHTVQVNGERGERMEPVVERIQRYVDHSRFLTAQSAQMLRTAVTLVAARKAEQTFAACEGLSQHERDERYLYAFFGREFIFELRELDSEFLHTGNKLLSLHSMDSTSLAQALFLLALARNDVRLEIIAEFERLTMGQLPQDELDYFAASNARYKFGPLFNKQKFQFLGHNARFVSLRGFFNAEIAGPDTMTPLQREFVRLAQIFKSRLVAEREIQQRVMERALIEDRFETNHLSELKLAFEKEKSTAKSLEEARRILREQVLAIEASTMPIFSIIEMLRQESQRIQGWGQELSDSLAQLDAGESKSFEGQVRAMRTRASNYVAETEGEKGVLRRLKESAAGSEQLLNVVKSPSVAADYRLPPNLKDVLWKNRWAYFDALPTRQSPSDLRFNVSVGSHKFSLAVKGDPSNDSHIAMVDIDDEGFNEAKKLIWTAHDRYASYIATLDQFELYSESRIRLDSIKRLMNTLQNFLDDPVKNQLPDVLFAMRVISGHILEISVAVDQESVRFAARLGRIVDDLKAEDVAHLVTHKEWMMLQSDVLKFLKPSGSLYRQAAQLFADVESGFKTLARQRLVVRLSEMSASESRRPLDHKKFLDMLVDDAEDKYIEILEGTRAHIANVDNYIGRIITALDDDLNTQFYHPTFQHIRDAGRFWDVQMGQIETTSVLTNNRTFAKVSPQAQMEFDLPKRDILISEAFESAAAAYQDYGALLQDPTFLSLTKMYSGQPTSSVYGAGMPNPIVRDVLPGLPSATNEQLLIQEGATAPDFPSALESLIPDPAVYKFETGTGFEIRPVIQPDGQAVVFHLNYMYTTNIREPVRADEKHLGRIKRHFVDTDVQLGNFELREVSRYTVALKASRTARGVPLLEDVPVAGILFRPLPQQESSLQQNLILSQATIFPTLFDLMGLRWAPAVADLDAMRLQELDFVTQGRRRDVQHRVFDYSSRQVDEFLRVPEADRRPDLYRPQETIPRQHPNSYNGPGLDLEELHEVRPSTEVPRMGMNPFDGERAGTTYIPGVFDAVPSIPPAAPPALAVEPPPTTGPSIQMQSYETPARSTPVPRTTDSRARTGNPPPPSRPVPPAKPVIRSQSDSTWPDGVPRVPPVAAQPSTSERKPAGKDAAKDSRSSWRLPFFQRTR